ncbi:MAG TPA: hypothetical protein VHE34_25775 [Puia sp.]|uniref:hypothetical protein n=1 Tax=Puia sp. TaxID=2045100 RepID=UPI002C2BCDB5|nr:hypothetical protein [Puia sp.]HVU98668.1 hypothetical protein [Puia sp.]
MTIVLGGGPYKTLVVGKMKDLKSREPFKAALGKALKGDVFPPCNASPATNDKNLTDLIDALVIERFPESHVAIVDTVAINDNNILKLGKETGNGYYNISNYLNVGNPVPLLVYSIPQSEYEFQWGAIGPVQIIRDNFEKLLQLYSELPRATVAPTLYLQPVAAGYQVVYSYDSYTATVPAPAVVLRKNVAERFLGDVNTTVTLGGVAGILFDIKYPKTAKKAKNDPAYKE